MKKILFFCLLTSSQCFGELNQDNDFQFWMMARVRKPISQCLDFEFLSEYRFGNNASELFLYYFQAQMVFSPKEWLEIAPGYRQQETSLLGEWFSSYNPLLDVSFLFSLGKTRVVDRSRFQYFINEGLPNLWVYRHRDDFFFRPVGRIQPYLYEELFLLKGADLCRIVWESGAIWS